LFAIEGSKKAISGLSVRELLRTYIQLKRSLEAVFTEEV